MKNIILPILFATTLVTKSQDVITKLDSSKINAVILEINPTEIKYKLFNYSEGPVISISPKQISHIVFKNGSTERYANSVLPVKNPQIPFSNFYDKPYFSILSPEEKDARCEKFYKYKNYVGFNHMAFLNNCIGFNYMRDIKALNLIVNVPISFGYDKPIITNSLYKSDYIEASDNFSYNKLNYQFGLSALFTPNMKRQANFLVGPSFLYTSYNVSTILNYKNLNNEPQAFTNEFKIQRKNYGVNVGFLARFSERFNMTMLVTLGYKLDDYNEKDPFGIEYVKSNSIGKNLNYNTKQESQLYANFLWTLGYRF